MEFYKTTDSIQYYKFAPIVCALYKCVCKIKHKTHPNAFEREFAKIYDIVKPLYDVTNNFINRNLDEKKGIMYELFCGKYRKPIIINGIKRKGNFTFDRAPAGFLSATLDNRIKWINQSVFNERSICIENVNYKNMRSKWYTKDFAEFIMNINKFTYNLTNNIRLIIKQANKAAYNEKNGICKTPITYAPGVLFDRDGNPFINVLAHGVITLHKLNVIT